VPGGVLTTASTVMCPHGGPAILTTSNTRLVIGGMPALLQTDVHSVVGCPFQIPFGVGTKPSPCIRIQWLSGTTRLSGAGGGVLVQSSVGLCFSPEGIPQGTAVIAAAQTQTTAV
jgi:hypothetical protein